MREEAAKAEGNSPTRAFQLQFWTAFRDYRAERKQGAPKPSAQSWQSFRVGRTGFSLEGVVRHAEKELAVRLYINCSDLPIKSVFRYLQARQTEIHAALGFELVWDELPAAKGSVAYVVRKGAPLDDETRWPECHEWLSATLAKMDAVFRPIIKPLQPADLPAAGRLAGGRHRRGVAVARLKDGWAPAARPFGALYPSKKSRFLCTWGSTCIENRVFYTHRRPPALSATVHARARPSRQAEPGAI